MAVRTNIGNGVVNVNAGDTTLFNPGAIDRYQVGSCNVYNTTGADIVVSVYVSPDTTSAAGDLVFTGTVHRWPRLHSTKHHYIGPIYWP